MNRWILAVIGFGLGIAGGLALSVALDSRSTANKADDVAAFKTKLASAQHVIDGDRSTMERVKDLANQAKESLAKIASERTTELAARDAKIADLEERLRLLSIDALENMQRLLEDESVMFDHHLKPLGGKKPMITSNPDGSESN